MYNLEVAQDHTFTVGTREWVVHNTCLNPREQNVVDNLDTLISDNGGDEGNILTGDETPSYNGQHPDIVTPNAIVEVTGENPDGSLPAKLQSGAKGWNQLTNFAKGANPGQRVYLVYDGDTSKFSPQLINFLNKWNITVIQYSGP